MPDSVPTTPAAAVKAVPDAAPSPTPPSPAAPAAPIPAAPAEPDQAAATILVDGATSQPQTDPAAKPPADGAPVEVKYDLKLPEGSTLKPTRVDEIVAEAKANGFSSETAQALLERESEAHSEWVQSQQTEAKAKVQEWFKAAESDPEIGGAKFQENAALAKKVIDVFGSDSLKQALNQSGLGNHPELLRIFTKIGKQMAPDQLVMPGNAPAPTKTQAEIMYPNMFKKQN